MRKTSILCTIVLLVTGFLFASPSWVGFLGTDPYQQNTATVDGDEQEHTPHIQVSKASIHTDGPTLSGTVQKVWGLFTYAS
ncbi:MAG: hypothetical protein JEY71_01380 [Sphaerochaeta sp.]|nr:hypothetical protein [Sphaerochaeta sp.]